MPSFPASNSPALRRFLTTGVSHAAIMGVVAMTAACLVGQASAQTTATPVAPPATTAAPAAPKPEEKKPAETTTTPPTQGETVTVVGEKPAVQNKIDRDVYDVSKDPDAPTSSGAEILNKVPGVNVDSDGNVTLRGQSGVQVQLNGRQNAALEGESRGATLQTLDADAIESIEVINNPSAAFSGGGGPIINIVLKKNRRLGNSGRANLRYGSAGRINGNATISSGGPLWSVSGGLNYSDDWRKTDSTSERESLNPSTSVRTYSTTDSKATRPRKSKGVNGSVEYNPTEKDTFGANFRFMQNDSESPEVRFTKNYDQNRVLTGDYYSVGQSENTGNNLNIGLNYGHRGKVDGEVLKIDYRHSDSNNDGDRLANYVYSLPTPRTSVEHTVTGRDTSIDQLGIDYTRPLSDTQRLQMGFDVEKRDENADNYFAVVDPVTSAETVNAMRTNLFKAETTVTSAFITYQRMLGAKWGAVFGLRVEDSQFNLNSVTQTMTARNRFTRWSPSLNLRRALGTGEQVRLSYSHRNERPNANQMNPFITYRDSQNISSGNPNLRPQQRDTIDAEYTKSTQKLNYSAGVSYQKFADTISSVSYFVPNPACTSTTVACDSVLLTTSDNSGSAESAGVRFNLGYRPSTKFNFQISPSYQYTNYESNASALYQRRSGGIAFINGNVSYKPTTIDTINANFNIRGASVQVQGRQSASNQLNLSYQRNISRKLTLGLQAQDVFRSQKNDTFTETPNGTVRTYNRPEGQVVYLSLSYTLGQVRGGNQDRMNRMNGGNRGGGGNEGPSGPGGPGGGFGSTPGL